MKLLLDTHTFLWFIAGDARLSPRVRELIEPSGTSVWLSVASLWEMAIKISLGRLAFDQPFEDFIAQQLEMNSVDLLNITVAHAAEVARLPFHHRDPFDRLLVAQASIERLALVSADTIFDAYNVQRLWE